MAITLTRSLQRRLRTFTRTRSPLPRQRHAPDGLRPSLAGASILAFVPTSTSGRRIDYVMLKGCSSSFTAPTVAQTVTIHRNDGTTAYPIKEIVVSAVTPPPRRCRMSPVRYPRHHAVNARWHIQHVC